MSLSIREEIELKMMLEQRRGSWFGCIVFAVAAIVAAFLLNRTLDILIATTSRLERLEKIHNLPYIKPWHNVQIKKGEYEGLEQTK